MKKIEFEKWERNKTFEWFKNFSNSTYSMNVKMDVTNLLKHTRHNNESFFIDLLYIVLKGLNSVEEMKMRLVDNIPVIYDEINPAFTVMTELGTFENVRFKNCEEFSEFYQIASQYIESAKKQSQIKKESYNPENCYNEYYITCVPWVDFTQFTHPIPDDKSSQCIPRICWGKYVEQEGKYELTLNITVSHIFVDGYPLAQTFNKIQELLNNVDEILKIRKELSMKIGIDLDGVVIDSETTFRTYEEIFAIEDLNHRKIINLEEPKYQDRYMWSKEEQQKFNEKYLLKASHESNLMSGFLPVYKKLKDLGFEMIVITARGVFIEEMKDDAIRLLNENNIVFDKYFWNIHDKLEICKKEKINVMIDDDYKIIQQLSNAKIKALYFRDTNLKKLDETDYVHEVNNWGDIYRYFSELK